MNQEKTQVLGQLNEMIDQTKGKVFMGMVHQMYGPLRGLNFILINAQAEDIMNSIDEQAIEMEPEFQLKLAEEIKDGKTPSNLIELVFKIWTDTGLSPRLMVLPEDFIRDFSKKSFFSSNKFYMKSFFISSRIVYIYFVQNGQT